MLVLDQMPHVSSRTNIHEAPQAFLVAQILKYYYGELKCKNDFHTCGQVKSYRISYICWDTGLACISVSVSSFSIKSDWWENFDRVFTMTYSKR